MASLTSGTKASMGWAQMMRKTHKDSFTAQGQGESILVQEASRTLGHCYGHLPMPIKYALEVAGETFAGLIIVQPQARSHVSERAASHLHHMCAHRAQSLREQLTTIMTIAALVAGFAVGISMETTEDEIEVYARWEILTFLGPSSKV